jgi:hypothetical protein
MVLEVVEDDQCRLFNCVRTNSWWAAAGWKNETVLEKQKPPKSVGSAQ